MNLTKRPRAVCLVILLAGFTVAPAMAAPILTVSPAAATVGLGTTIWVDVNIADVADLSSFDVILTFDPLVVNAAQTKLGNFLASPTFFFSDILDNSLGQVSGVGVELGAVPGVTGSGTLFSVQFAAMNFGTSPLGYELAQLLNSELEFMKVETSPGSLQVVPEPATLTLVGFGVFGAVVRARRRSPRS